MKEIPFCVRIDPATRDILRLAAGERGLTVGAVVRDAIARWLMVEFAPTLGAGPTREAL